MRKLATMGICLLAYLALNRPARVEAAEAPTPDRYVYFQTNGPSAPITDGDWYTNRANGVAIGFTYLSINLPCGWPRNLPVMIDLQSPEMNSSDTQYDEGAAMGVTTFELYSPGTLPPTATTPHLPAPYTGISGSLTTYPASYQPWQSNLSPAKSPVTSTSGLDEGWVRYHTLAAPVACGVYLLRAQSSDGDQNGWRLRVGYDPDADPNNPPPPHADDPDARPGSGDELTIAILQATLVHHQDDHTKQCADLYQFVAPTTQAAFHNFDMDANPSTTNGLPENTVYNTITYISPDGRTYQPPPSGNGVWNGGTQFSRGRGDVIARPYPGWWRIHTCSDVKNQYIQEGQSGQPLYTVQPPTPILTYTPPLAPPHPDATHATYILSLANVSDHTTTPGAATGITVTVRLTPAQHYVSCGFVATLHGSCRLSATHAVDYQVADLLAAGQSGSISLTLGDAQTAASDRITLAYHDLLGNRYTPAFNPPPLQPLPDTGAGYGGVMGGLLLIGGLLLVGMGLGMRRVAWCSQP